MAKKIIGSNVIDTEPELTKIQIDFCRNSLQEKKKYLENLIANGARTITSESDSLHASDLNEIASYTANLDVNACIIGDKSEALRKVVNALNRIANNRFGYDIKTGLRLPWIVLELCPDITELPEKYLENQRK